MKGFNAFTMAEILLSLTIIGVVAAITLPSLTGNLNERTWNTQRKALYARMSQAISLMPTLNGYGTLDDTTDTAAETFLTAGLAKVFKINNICDNEHLEDCGIPASLIDISGTKVALPGTLHDLNGMFSIYNRYVENSKAAAFETQNGESIAVYYNPKCKYDDHCPEGWTCSQFIMCANFIYDLNGKKGPNTFGKDIGVITAFHPVDPIVVAPMPLSKNATNNAGAYGKSCSKHGSEGRIPNSYELSAMSYNHKIMGVPESLYCAQEPSWGEYFNSGVRGKVGCITLRCIER